MITVIGNGESRKAIGVSKIQGLKIGCNGIYLHEQVDIICAMDKFWRDKIAKETNIPLISRFHNNTFQQMLEIYENDNWTNTNVPYRGYCSGISALDYICVNYKDDIYMIGFDFDYKGTTVNHIYKGTQFHPPADRPVQNKNIFLKEFIDTVKRYPRHNIYWVNSSTTKLPNIERMSISNFKKIAYE